MIVESDTFRLLIDEFKEMKEEYDKDITELDYAKEFPCLFYLCCFTPYIIEQLDNDNKSELKKIFAFIERLLAEGDKDVKDIVLESVLEAIYHDYDFANYEDVVFDLCGKLTRKVFENELMKQQQTATA